MVLVQSSKKLICVGGPRTWGPALTPLFSWPACKGGLRGGAGEREQALRGLWWSTGLCWPPNAFRVSVALVSTICLGTPVEQTAIWVAELGGMEETRWTPLARPTRRASAPFCCSLGPLLRVPAVGAVSGGAGDRCDRGVSESSPRHWPGTGVHRCPLSSGTLHGLSEGLRGTQASPGSKDESTF